LNSEVNMWRATGVRNGFDGAKQVIACRAGHETSEALKVHIALVLVDRAAVNVGAVVVALPDFDESAADRLAVTVEDAAAQIAGRAHGRRDRVVYDQQVVVGVERHLVRVERPFGLSRRLDQLLGENAWREQGADSDGAGCPGRANAQKMSSSPKEVVVIHGFGVSLV